MLVYDYPRNGETLERLSPVSRPAEVVALEKDLNQGEYWYRCGRRSVFRSFLDLSPTSESVEATHATNPYTHDLSCKECACCGTHCCQISY